jgi:hypothetical protein
MGLLPLLISAFAGFAAVNEKESTTMRLVPFPKEIEVRQGVFAVKPDLVLEAPAGAAPLLAAQVEAELRRAGLPAPKAQPLEKEARFWRLSSKAGASAPQLRLRDGAGAEDYVLEVKPDGVVCSAPGEAGLFYGLQTLLQLIRANRRDDGLPCLTIRDWPSLRWRCYQDDMTRGPSSKLDTLKHEADWGAHLKMNLFTYYMEYQYAFRKHPVIGPPDGSLEPKDLTALVNYAQPLHVDILGNQQSFGHWARILEHEEYARLRETPHILTPVKEESYQLLDDLYSEICPLLPFPMFNVCCDETDGLGTGPSKGLAEQIGVGGVYVRHMRRLHDMLKEKYNKRMLMWGDIILRHPGDLAQIPKDTVMLTWGYDPRDNFESQIVPFSESGYEFFVCPGISNWSRILPDFQTATVNIRNFVRDGAKHGAIGMLNTEWEDDGEALQGYKWHGYAWGAECAWNASATDPKDFNRRIGAILFGEEEDRFGRAIELLSRLGNMPNQLFWNKDFRPAEGPAEIRAAANSMLEVVRPAIEDLETCKRQAIANRALLDVFLLGARRIERMAQRRLDGLETAQLYAKACKAGREEAAQLLTRAENLVRENRDAHRALGEEFQRIWLSESKPYALDWTMKRYAETVKEYDDVAERIARIRQDAAEGKALPSPEDAGLALPEKPAR